MKRIYFPFFACLLLISGVLKAQQNNGSNSGNIIESLATPDSLTNATARVYQDKRIEQLIANKRNAGSSKQATVSGYRVQVFSSNVQRTAKADAFRIERQIREVFPEQMVYVNYISPFWKVRVGDFKTQAQAQAFRAQLISSFPQMRSEVYVVREQISISGTK
jgi:hypothetical protein